jgi:hypothetical protein
MPSCHWLIQFPLVIMIIACGTRRDKQEDVRSFPDSAHEAIRSLVRRAIKSGDTRRDLDANDLLRDLVGVSNVVSGSPLTRLSVDRPHNDATDGWDRM